MTVDVISASTVAAVLDVCSAAKKPAFPALWESWLGRTFARVDLFL